jgi:hypothetical protein
MTAALVRRWLDAGELELPASYDNFDFPGDQTVSGFVR